MGSMSRAAKQCMQEQKVLRECKHCAVQLA